jgi:thioredoxin-related protein
MTKSIARVFFAVAALTLGSGAFALEAGDAAPCVVLDGVNASGQAVNGCIRDTVSPGQTHTIIDFFSVFCSTCKKNLPAVAQLTHALATSATVRYVSIDKKKADIENFLKDPLNKTHINNPVAFDLERDAKTAYGVVSTPTMFILDANYKIVYKHTGELTQKDIQEITQLVQSDEE